MGKPKPTAYKLCDTLTFAICKGIPAVREQTNRLTRVAEGPDQVGETLLLAYQGYVKIMIDWSCCGVEKLTYLRTRKPYALAAGCTTSV